MNKTPSLDISLDIVHYATYAIILAELPCIHYIFETASFFDGQIRFFCTTIFAQEVLIIEYLTQVSLLICMCDLTYYSSHLPLRLLLILLLHMSSSRKGRCEE